MKKTVVLLTVAMFMFTSLAYAGGGKGTGGKAKGYSGSIGKGAVKQTRIHTQDGTGKGSAGTIGGGDQTQSRTQSRDESCN